VPKEKGAGMQVTTNVYPHIWPYMVSHLKSSPFSDIRIRKAANLAIDRENLTKFLGGLAVPAQGMVTPDHPWFGNPTFKVKYDPDGARKLMAEAGYSKSNPVNVNVTMSAAGSGQMQPLPMNEFIQENFRDVGINMSLSTVDWEALRSRRFAGAEGALNKGVDAINYSWSIQYPVFGLIGQTYHSENRVKGYNWGHFADKKADQLALYADSPYRSYTCITCHEHNTPELISAHELHGVKDFHRCLVCHQTEINGIRFGRQRVNWDYDPNW